MRSQTCVRIALPSRVQVRMATPVCKSHLSSSSTSSSIASSSSSSTPARKKQKLEEKGTAEPPVSGSSAAGKVDKVCSACLTRGDHNALQCPLLMAFATGSEDDIKKAKAFCWGLSRMKSRASDAHEWANAHERPWIPIADTQVSRIRSDGHCLFAAIFAPGCAAQVEPCQGI